MSIAHYIPIARLNGTVRKRLFGILASECAVHFSHHSEREGEAEGRSSSCQEMAARASKSSRKALTVLHKRPKVEKGAMVNTLENHAASESSVNQFQSETAVGKVESGELNRGIQADKSEAIKKRRRPRLFRRFLRILPCNSKQSADKNSSRRVFGNETTITGEGLAATAEQIPSNTDVLSHCSMEGEGIVNKVVIDGKDIDQVVPVGDLDSESCKSSNSGEELTTEYNHKSHPLGVGSEGKTDSSYKMEPGSMEGCTNLELRPDKAEQILSKKHELSSSLVNQDILGNRVNFEEPESSTCNATHKSDDSLYLNLLFNNTHENTLDFKTKPMKKTTKSARPRRKDKRRKVKHIAEEEDDEKVTKNDECETKNKAKKRTPRTPNALPNYFLALRVDNPAIHNIVKEFQEHIINEAPLYRHVMIPVPTLHLTLLVMRLDNENDIESAKDALQESKEVIQCIFNQCHKELTFSGIDSFRNKVVYLGVKKESQQEMLSTLQEAVSTLRDHYSTKGIEMAGNGKGKFVPHVTIMKMSKNVGKMKKNGIKHIDQKLYKDFLGHNFGTQKFSEILLCSMLDKKDETGFYNVIDRIDISM